MRTHFNTHILPVVVVVELYIGGDFHGVSSDSLFTGAGYEAYTATFWAKSLSAILYALVFVEFAAFLIKLIHETRKRRGVLCVIV